MARSGRGSGASTPMVAAAPQHMYFLEGGLLVVSNLLKTNVWVHDAERSHCSICVQQFMPFRRRHHCRTCGEVVCGGCSSQRKIHLTEVNVECSTRICSFCMIRATNAALHANDTTIRETIAHEAARLSVMTVMAPYPSGRHTRGGPPYPAARRGDKSGGYPANAAAPPPPPTPPYHYRDHPNQHHHHHHAGHAGHAGHASGLRTSAMHHSMLSIESELTDGSVVQLWPSPIPDNEHARLQIVRNATIRMAESDPTMTLLVSIVARTLECPVAFIGMLDDEHLWFKATVGWDKTCIPRDDCVCGLLEKTVIVADTNRDKHFHANTLAIEGRPLRHYAGAPIRVLGQVIGAVSAIDTVPHEDTTSSMRSTLEAVANIVSEVLEQRVDSNGRPTEPLMSLVLASSASMRSLPKTQSGLSNSDSDCTLVELSDSIKDLNLLGVCGSSLDDGDHDGAGADNEEEDALSIDEQMSSDEEEDDEDDDGVTSLGDDDTDIDGVPVHPWPPTWLAHSVITGSSSSSLASLDLTATTSMSTSSTAGTLTAQSSTLSTLSAVSATPRFSITIPLGPPALGDKIGQAMEFFQRLQRSRWRSAEGMIDNEVRAFDIELDLDLEEELSDDMAAVTRTSRWSIARRSHHDASHDRRRRHRTFTKSHGHHLVGDCSSVLARVQGYDDARLYADVFSSVTAQRQTMNVQTWVDHVDLRPNRDVVGLGGEEEEEEEGSALANVRVLSHWRQYPDGSNVIVAFNDSTDDRLMAEDFLFGWFVAPSAPEPGSTHSGRNSVNVTCIVGQPLHGTGDHHPHHYERSSECAPSNNQAPGATRNLSLELITRLQHSLPYRYQSPSLSPTVSDAEIPFLPSLHDNQLDHGDITGVPALGMDPQLHASADAAMLGTLVGRRPRVGSDYQGATDRTTLGDMTQSIRRYQEEATLNDNERMLLDLLDKTISTQEVLAAQQHVMANVMDYHGSQLQRISSAIDRVETILSSNDTQIKLMGHSSSPPTGGVCSIST